MKTILTKNQVMQKTKVYVEDGKKYKITVKLRYDGECGNGHNTFTITADIDRRSGKGRWVDFMGGCCYNEIIKHFPEYVPFIKWHLCSPGEPLHYLANTLYFAGNRKLDDARYTAIWPDATDEELTSPDLKQKLIDRLPVLMAEFKKAVESLGFVY